MARTTLAIDDDVLREIKRRAAEEMVPMHAVVNRLLRNAIALTEDVGYRLRLRTWKAELQPGVDLCDRDSLLDAMDGNKTR